MDTLPLILLKKKTIAGSFALLNFDTPIAIIVAWCRNNYGAGQRVAG